MNICDPRQSIVFEHSPLAYGVYIQRMDITIWNCVLADTLEDMLLTLGSGWCYLLIPTRTLRVDTSMISRKRTRVSENIGGTDWQLHSSNLKTLKLTVVVRDFPHRGLEYECRQCRIHPGLVKKVEKASKSATFHAWSRLPTELKLEILSHHLKQSNSIRRLTRMWNLGAILGTRNRELVTLGLEACYSINELVINSAHLFHHGTSIRFPPLAYGKLVRNIRFEMRCSIPCVAISTDHYFANKRNGWEPFFKKIEPSGTGSEYIRRAKRPDWRTLFPSVRNLALFISLDDAGRIGKFCTCGSLSANLHVLNNWLGTAEFELQAENVEVSIFNENRLKSVGNQNCQCTKATEDIIKKMATRVKGGPRLS
jgi:hypothetical protein